MQSWNVDKNSKAKPLPIPKFLNKYKAKLWKLNKALESALGI